MNSMRTIGMIGGMSWESTAEYYRLINQDVRTRLGGLNSAQALLHSVNFAPIERLQRDGQWNIAGIRLAEAARNLEAGGAHCIVLCTNTMHKVFNEIQSAVGIPFLHLADATTERHELRRVRRSEVSARLIRFRGWRRRIDRGRRS